MAYRKKIVEYEKLTAQLQQLGIKKSEFMRDIGFNKGTIGKWSGACSAALGRIALRAHALSPEAQTLLSDPSHPKINTSNGAAL